MIRFTDILGQESAIEELRRALAADRLAHGMIFSGPAGIGKATTAMALGALLLCERPKGGHACGSCPSCTAMSSGAHPDYHVITRELARVHDKSGASKATQLSIEVVRQELTLPASRKSVLGKGKIFCFEQAEWMTAPTQNALLKTLEEPAGRTVIILIAAEPGQLLSTVRSRCQVIRFASLDEKLVREQLQKRGINKEIAATAAELSDGSLGAALRLIEDEALVPAKSVGAAMDAILAGQRAADLPEMLRKSAEQQAEKALQRDELASKDWAMRNGIGLFLAVAAQRLRKRLTESADVNVLERACGAIDAVACAEKYLDANVTVSLVLEQLGVALNAGGTN